eukprot:s5483_g2.t1
MPITAGPPAAVEKSADEMLDEELRKTNAQSSTDQPNDADREQPFLDACAATGAELLQQSGMAESTETFDTKDPLTPFLAYVLFVLHYRNNPFSDSWLIFKHSEMREIRDGKRAVVAHCRPWSTISHAEIDVVCLELLSLFEEAPPPESMNSGVFRTFAKALISAKIRALADPETATLVNAVTYSSVLKSFNHQKRFHRVWEVYEEHTTRCALCAQLCARSAYREMIKQKVEFSVTTYNALLDVCARSGEISRAEPLLKEPGDMADQGVPPNIITYGTVIKAYCSANRLDQAFAVLEEMQKNTSLHPDEVTYNTLLDGCARYGLFDRGLDREVLADMRRAGVPPSNYTLSVIAKLANRSKKPKKAFEMVDTLRKEFGLKLNMHVYNNLIHAATCDSNMMKAQEVFGTMLDERVRPDGRTYTLLLRFCITQKAAVPATALLRTAFGLKHQKDDLVKTGSEDSLHPLLVKALLRSCHWAAAPLRGNSALQEEVIQDSFDFLSRSLDSSGVFSDGAIGVPQEPMLAKHWLLAAAAHGIGPGELGSNSASTRGETVAPSDGNMGLDLTASQKASWHLHR